VSFVYAINIIDDEQSVFNAAKIEIISETTKKKVEIFRLPP
jgi:hypothetical protein